MIPIARLGATSSLERETEGFDNQLVGAAHRQCSQRTAAMPRQFATLLGLEAGGSMGERVITLLIDDEPVLTSTSYLPVELMDNSTQWHEVEIGKLAVTGSTVIPGEFLESWSRWPTPAERTALTIPKGADIPVNIYSQTYHVQIGERRLPSGVIVLARGDRVILRWGVEYQGFMLVG
jgi:hypothetical protein